MQEIFQTHISGDTEITKINNEIKQIAKDAIPEADQVEKVVPQ